MKFKGIGIKDNRQNEITVVAQSRDEAFQKMKIFDVIYPENISLFTILDIYNSSNDETTLLKRKRSLKRALK